MKWLSLGVLSLCALGIFAGDAAEVDAVRKVVEDAYINGTQKGNTDAMRKGFHSEFIMFIRGDDGEVRKMTRDGWIERMEEGKKKNPDRKPAEVKGVFPLIEVEGNAAVVRVDVWRNGEYAFTDFMSLYKFEDGWKLVGKIFQRQ